MKQSKVIFTAVLVLGISLLCFSVSPDVHAETTATSMQYANCSMYPDPDNRDLIVQFVYNLYGYSDGVWHANVRLLLYNRSDQDVLFDADYVRIKPTFNCNVASLIDLTSESGPFSLNASASGWFNFACNDSAILYENKIMVPANTQYSSYHDIIIRYDSGNVPSIYSSSSDSRYPQLITPSSVTYGSYPDYSIFRNVYNILQSLVGNPVVNQDISDGSAAIESDAETIEQQEQQWYQDNEDAIEATGLSNFRFSTNQISGLGVISSQFARLWEALGQWTLVYTFVLLLSFATFVLRHRPSTKMQQRVTSMEREQFINKAVRSQRDDLYRHYWERYHK